MIPLEFLLFVKVPIRLEVAARAQRTQLQHHFRTLEVPTRPRQVHPIFHEMATGAFNDPCGNGKSLCQKRIVTQIGLAIKQRVRARVHRFALLGR